MSKDKSSDVSADASADALARIIFNTVWSFTPETFDLDRILLIFYIQLLLTSFSKTTYPAISYLTNKSHETSIQVPF